MEKCNELRSDKLRLSLGSILGRQSWNRFPGGRTAEHLLRVSLRDVDDASRPCLRIITPSRLSAVALFSRVTLAMVDWNGDQFCENSTMLFTVSESGVY